MDNTYKIGTMLNEFPAVELGKMISKLDRFEESLPEYRKRELVAIEAANEITDKIVEENL